MSVHWRLNQVFRQDGKDFLQGLYRELLGRTPDKAGLHNHLRSLRTGKTKFEVFQTFVSSEEFQIQLCRQSTQMRADSALERLIRVMANPDELFLIGLYREVLNRDPDSSGLSTQLEQLTKGKLKQEVVRGLLRSDELRIKLSDKSQATPNCVQLIVAVTHCSIEQVKNCISSIKRTIVHIPYEIIVVDNGSDYDTREALYHYARKEQLHFILKPGVDTIGDTLSTGIRLADGDFVLLTSSDVEFQEQGWLEKMVDAMSLSANIGIVQLRVTDINLDVQPLLQDSNPVALLVRAAVFDQVGYCSKQATDVSIAFTDLLTRAEKRGWRTLCKAQQILGVDEWTEVTSTLYSPFSRFEIVYVLELTGVSGGIKDVFEHVNHLHELGYRVHLFALDGQPNWFPLNVKVRKFRDYPEMVRELKQMNALKVATWWKTLSVVMESCDEGKGGRGIPCYLIQDIEESYYPDEPAMRALVRQTYREPVHLITIADWTARQLAQRFSRQAANISIGIDHKIFMPKRTNLYNSQRILACSRKSQHLKGFGVTTKAVQQVLRSLPNASFMTFGVEYPDVPGIPVQHISGPTDSEIAGLYSNCGVFVQTSNHEGFGLPILEAMACGAPVVATKADGNEEFCLDGYNCVLVERGNVDQVAKGIIRILTDQEFAQKLSVHGRQTALRYNWSRVMGRLNNVFGQFAQFFVQD